MSGVNYLHLYCLCSKPCPSLSPSLNCMLPIFILSIFSLVPDLMVELNSMFSPTIYNPKHWFSCFYFSLVFFFFLLTSEIWSLSEIQSITLVISPQTFFRALFHSQDFNSSILVPAASWVLLLCYGLIWRPSSCSLSWLFSFFIISLLSSNSSFTEYPKSISPFHFAVTFLRLWPYDMGFSLPGISQKKSWDRLAYW